MERYNLLQILGGLFSLALVVLAPAAVAQQVATPPLVRIVIPSVAGSSTDVIARVLANQLGPRLGTNVIVDNRPGGSGFIAAGAVAKGPRDGSMLLLFSTSLVTTAATMKTVPFDVMTDLVPVSMLGEGPLVVAVVSTRTDIKTPGDLVAVARAKPDTLTHGTAGVGTLAHVTAELLNEAAGIQLKHIPYKGAAQALVDLASGNIDAMIAVNSSLAPQIRSGRVRAIGVTSLKPSSAFPGLPTMASVVPGFAVDLWTAVFVPVGTPPGIVERLNREINEVAKSKEMREVMASDGAIPLALTPEESGRRYREAYALWKKLATTKNIVLE